MEIAKITASVKVMRSYDYCHFEVCLSVDNIDLTVESDGSSATDELRKVAARLADKAVEQYKVAKREEEKRDQERSNRFYQVKEMEYIEALAEGDRTIKQIAELKVFKDKQWLVRREYDYQDDWEEQD